MKDRVRDRLLLPLAIPVGALLLIALVTIALSRILLGVPPVVATAVAIMASISVLSVFAVISLRDRVRAPEALLMAFVAAVPFVLGGAVAAGLVGISEPKEDHAAKGPSPTGETTARPSTGARLRLSARDVAFDAAEMLAPAGAPFELIFENLDSFAAHNVAILSERGGDRLFGEAPFNGPNTVTYRVPALPAGEYYFQCDVHPNMNGTLRAR